MSEHDLIKNILSSEVVSEAYKDAIKPAFVTMGNAINGILRFVALPFSFLGMTADALEAKYKDFINNSIEKIPEEKRQIPKAVIAAPLLDHVKFVFDEPLLTEMFSNLLAAAANKDIASLIRPSFVEILKQMSPLDAKLLDDNFKENSKVKLLNIKWKYGPKQLLVTIDSLERLGILQTSTLTQDPDNVLSPTNLGEMFLSFCFLKESTQNEEMLLSKVDLGALDSDWMSSTFLSDLIFKASVSFYRETSSTSVIIEDAVNATHDERDGAKLILLFRIINLSPYSISIETVEISSPSYGKIQPYNFSKYTLASRGFANYIFDAKEPKLFFKSLLNKKARINVKTAATNLEMELPYDTVMAIRHCLKRKVIR